MTSRFLKTKFFVSYLGVLLLLAATCATSASARSLQEITVRGSLARTVEAGGWVLNAEQGKYLILNHRRFQNQPWFREGAEVEATGTPRPGTITIYQEGIPFEAREMRQLARRSDSDQSNSPQLAVAGRTQVTVTGNSIVQAQPDTAIIQVAVVTQNKSALAAQEENARRSDAVVRAVRDAAGADAEVKTSGYSLQPQRVYRENQPPTITGYEARNGVFVTLTDLNRVGRVIDAASAAGANSVDSLQFILRRDQPARQQALTEATRDALAKAQAIASALGGRVVRIVELQEAGTFRPRPVQDAVAEFGAAKIRQSVATPIEVGALDLTSQVQLTAEIETRP